MEGWRRIADLRITQPDSRKAFVAMSFADEMESPWLEGFKKGIEDTDYFRTTTKDLLSRASTWEGDG